MRRTAEERPRQAGTPPALRNCLNSREVAQAHPCDQGQLEEDKVRRLSKTQQAISAAALLY